MGLVPGHQNRWREVRKAVGTGPTIYWMSRDQRLEDNWALFHAWVRAREAGRPMGVVFCLSPRYSLAGPRHYHFMIHGLQEMVAKAQDMGMPFFILRGDPVRTLPPFLEEWKVSLAVTDFDPLREKGQWREAVMERSECGFEEVDAHNIVPCWQASPKQEFSAATFRPKIRLHLPEHLPHLPPRPGKFPHWPGEVPNADLDSAFKELGDRPDDRWVGGEAEAQRVMRRFANSGLQGYASQRNDPNLNAQSGLSPYLHFGMVSAQRVAVEVDASSTSPSDKDAFLEELIVRRELSDNFCHYNPLYDSIEGFPAWSRVSLREHLDDRREHLYTLEELEAGRTHDPLWNSAQVQMVREGKMHGWLRMYWAKKILEWTEGPDQALRTVNELNDRYEMDGRDPNGYVGAAWSIGGVHDRAWGERPIFGKVRYMNLNGARRKFDVDLFVSRFSDHPDR
jgi:deoxyribodipyrimidine photo-lyase